MGLEWNRNREHVGSFLDRKQVLLCVRCEAQEQARMDSCWLWNMMPNRFF